MKIIHIKSQTSVALPIYSSDLSHLDVQGVAEKNAQTPKKEVKISFFLKCLSCVKVSCICKISGSCGFRERQRR